MKAFARLKKKIWYLYLAYVIKLAKYTNSVNYLLFLQDLFDRTIDAKEMKTKNSTETVRAFMTMNTKKNQTKKFRVNKEQTLLERIKNYARLKEYKVNLQ